MMLLKTNKPLPARSEIRKLARDEIKLMRSDGFFAAPGMLMLSNGHITTRSGAAHPAISASRAYRKFNRAANSKLKTAGAARKSSGSTIYIENGIGPWLVTDSRSMANKIRRRISID